MPHILLLGVFGRAEAVDNLATLVLRRDVLDWLCVGHINLEKEHTVLLSLFLDVIKAMLDILKSSLMFEHELCLMKKELGC